MNTQTTITLISTSNRGDYHTGMIHNARDKVGFLVSWNTKGGTYVQGSGQFLCPCCIEVEEMRVLVQEVSKLKSQGVLETVYFDLYVEWGSNGRFAYEKKMIPLHTYSRLPICFEKDMLLRVYQAMVDAIFSKEPKELLQEELRKKML